MMSAPGNQIALCGPDCVPRTMVPVPQKICIGGAIIGPLMVRVPLLFKQDGPSNLSVTPAGIVAVVKLGIANIGISITPDVPAQIIAAASVAFAVPSTMQFPFHFPTVCGPVKAQAPVRGQAKVSGCKVLPIVLPEYSTW